MTSSRNIAAVLCVTWLSMACRMPAFGDNLASPTSDHRELLELFGAPRAALEPPVNEQDFSPGGEETLWRLLFAVRRFPLAKLDLWKQADVSVADVLAAPDRHQAEIVAWSGRARRVTKEVLPAETAELFDLEHYYRCELAIGTDRDAVIVYSLAVPEAWKLDEPLDEAVAVTGFLVRLAAGTEERESREARRVSEEKTEARRVSEGETEARRVSEGEMAHDPRLRVGLPKDGEPAESKARPVLIARRVAWFPSNVLGDLQMDAGLFDELNPRPEWGAEDRECFYQLLAAVGRAGPRQLLKHAPEKCPVEPLFNDPQDQRGKLVALTGTARQAVPVQVDDADIRARFGIDRYYEIELFTEDSQGNPLTFCVRELPKGFPTGGNIHEPVRIAGIYLKKWSYRVQAVGDGAKRDDKPAARRRQLAPLIIGPEPIWLGPPPIDYRLITTIFVVLFVALTIVLWLVVWWLNRSGERFHKQVVKRLMTSPERSLNEIGLEDRGKPDFSNLG